MSNPENNPDLVIHRIPDAVLQYSGALLKFSAITLEIDPADLAECPEGYAQLLANLGNTASVGALDLDLRLHHTKEPGVSRPPLTIIDKNGKPAEVVTDVSICQFIGSLDDYTDTTFISRRSLATRLWKSWSRIVHDYSEGTSRDYDDLQDVTYKPNGQLAYIPLSRFNALAALTTESLEPSQEYILSALQEALQAHQLVNKPQSSHRETDSIKRQYHIMQEGRDGDPTIPVTTPLTFRSFIINQPEYADAHTITTSNISTRLWNATAKMLTSAKLGDLAEFDGWAMKCIPIVNLTAIVDYMAQPKLRTPPRRLELFRRFLDELKQDPTIDKEVFKTAD